MIVSGGQQRDLAIHIHVSILLQTPLPYQSISSVAKLCLTLCDLMDYSTPGFAAHHQLLEFVQTHVH